MMKKRLLTVFILTILGLTLSGHSPLQLLVNFIAAGAVPGVHLLVSPYVMFGLALICGLAILIMLPLMDFRLSHHQTEAKDEKPVKSLKMTSHTHHKPAKARRRFTQIEV